LRKQHIIAAALAFSCASVVAAQAQSPSTSQRSTSQNTAQDSSRQQTTTISGCVYREDDVPGRSPNLAERAGILEDYILAEVRGTTAASGASGAVGTSGSTEPRFGTMYKLERIDDGKLKAVVGKRVEVTGRIDKEAGDSSKSPAATPNPTQTDRVMGRDRVDLAEFEVTSIREVSGSCPAEAPGR
jgi:hypothetical protein